MPTNKFSMKKMCATLLALAIVITTGCALQGPIHQGDATSLPKPFALTFLSISTTGRQVYYEVREDGMIAFGGGRNALTQKARPLDKLNDQQRMQLWSIVRENNLLDAEGSWGDGEKVKYDASFTAGARKNRFRTCDDRVPGLDQLDALLFSMQSEFNYRSVFQAINEKVRKSGGAVPKK